jgi:hypothetical protein
MPNDFWNNALTEKSWNILINLKKEPFDFVLIGGWAAYLHTNLHKSKDIDIVIKNFEDLEKIKKRYNLIKNDSLKKYEIKMEEIDVDIYVPFFSRLAIPTEEIIKHTTKIQNIEVVKPELLLILKQGAEKDREFSVKGEKDRIDIITLLFFSEIDFKEYHDLIAKYQLNNFYERLKKIILNFKDTKYLGLTPRDLKLRKDGTLKKLKEI